jgi:hypothetical protein
MPFYKGYFLGKYRLLNYLANGSACTRYLAVNEISKERVEIVVRPPSKRAAFFVIPPGSLLDVDED